MKRISISKMIIGVIISFVGMLFFIIVEASVYAIPIFLIFNSIAWRFGIPTLGYVDVFGIIIMLRLLFQYPLVKILSTLRDFDTKNKPPIIIPFTPPPLDKTEKEGVEEK